MTLLNPWLITAFALAVDQISKWIALEIFDLPTVGTVVLVPGFLKFALAWNTGVNFGLMASGSMVARWGLVAAAICVSLGLFWWIRNGADIPRRLGVGLIAGGALANALDRVVHGAVVDFLNVSAFGFDNPFSFNFADVWIFVGAALLFLSGEQKSNTDRRHGRQLSSR